MGIVIVDDDITIDQEKVNEERRAYLEEELSAAVCRVLSGNADPDIGEKGRSHVIQHHNWQAQTDKLVRLLSNGG